MAKTTDYNTMFKDAMNAFPMDMSAFQNMFKTSAGYGEKLSKVALEAADKSAEVSAKWTKDTLAKLGDVTKVKEDVADYGKSLTDFASTQAEMAAEHMAAFAEIAKKVQAETVELLMAAGKTASDDASAAVKKAAAEVTATAKKAAAAAK
ncbi:phasin family protein [Frigidibacter sp. ROC022]|uniref:phasin family protein n=1 Tax=Frigidibacter sp. ROC022 TaxID=2971796 RepID=UPI00215AA44A|nr:phasin family protein [Frigidibacter sp. ROC022]MCR8723058.1 phasin, PhaP [Frigidibacter sp. ROC022]